MAREPVQKIINNNTYEIQPWPAMHGLKMQAKVAKLLGSAIGDLSVDGAPSANQFSQMVEDIVHNIDPEETPKLIQELLQGVYVNNQDISMSRVFNEHFQCNYFELFEAIKAVLEVNLQDIFFKLASFGDQSSASQANTETS